MAIAYGIMAGQRSVAGGVLPSSKHQLQEFPVLAEAVKRGESVPIGFLLDGGEVR